MRSIIVLPTTRMDGAGSGIRGHLEAGVIRVRVDRDRQARPAAELEGGAAGGAGQDLQLRLGPQELGQRGLELQTRQWRTDAEVDPAAEREVGRVRTPDVEPIGFGESPRVAVRRADDERDP